MNLSRRLIFVSIFGLFGVVAGLVVTYQVKLNQPTAGLLVETNTRTLVFLDNKQIGTTPLDQKLPPGEVLLKLIPEASTLSAQAFQTKIKLTDNVYTLVRRDFSVSEQSSAGETVMLVPVGGESSPLSIVSDPDSASVIVDNQPQGFTPLNLDTLTAGVHQLDISAPGYAPRSVSIKAVSGYKLQIISKLAADGKSVSLPSPADFGSSAAATASASVSATSSASFVKVLSTPTGFLRVRQKPTTGALEVARVEPGDRLPLLETQTGWYRISLDSAAATSSGWISSEFASLD